MKRKLIVLLLLLTLIFTVGCNKEAKQPDATPTPAATSTPTPTPVPENLAKTALEKLPTAYDTMISKQPAYTTDYSNGIGYDMQMDVSLSQEIMELFGLSDIKNISLKGSMDYKNVFGGTFALLLNQDEILELSMMTDFKNMFFNLPKYSTQYASASLAELTDTEELSLDMSEIPSDAELYDMIGSYLTRFVDCFKPQTDIVNNVTIGTGEYVITGDKHTVIASKEEVLTLLEELEAELSFGAEELLTDTELSSEVSDSSSTSIILNYYAGTNNSYAWEILTDSPDSEPVIFVSAPTGFCLYGLSDGTPEVIFYSIATTETEGVLYIPGTLPEDAAAGTEAEILGEFEYEYSEDSFAIEGYYDTVELSAEYSVKNDVIEFEYEVVVEGISIEMTETATKDRVDAKITVASFGMRLGIITIAADLRDYAEVSVPQNSVDLETWQAELDTLTLSGDLLALIEKYPFLADFLFPGDDPGDDTEYDDPYSDTRDPFTVPEDYTNEFMGMTGYYVDADGYVDFTPLESEVLAAGKPSTGCDSTPLTDAQKQAMIDLCAGLFTDYSHDISTYYSVWGSIEYDMVNSYYQTEYYYSDNNNYNCFIFLNFDAVSGDFISLSIYTDSQEKTLQAMNTALDILGVDTTVTADDVATYAQIGDFVLYGYSDETSYGVGLEVYYEE